MMGKISKLGISTMLYVILLTLLVAELQTEVFTPIGFLFLFAFGSMGMFMVILGHLDE